MAGSAPDPIRDFAQRLVQLGRMALPDERLARIVLRNLTAEADQPLAKGDLSFCPDPRRLSRPETVRLILGPAQAAGWLPETDPVLFLRQLESLPDPVVKEWGAQVLHDHPWVPGTVMPSFEEFVHSEEFLGEFALTDRQALIFHESIGIHAEDWLVKPRAISLLVLELGKGAGKDTVSAEVFAYACYAIANMRNPWFHFNSTQGSPIGCINVAPTARQARRIFFRYLHRMLTRGCFAHLLDQRPIRGDIHGDEVTFRRKVPGHAQPLDIISLLSLHSQGEGAEGSNTLLFVMDEADAFRTAEGHANADLMFNTLTTSNRFQDLQLGIIISYPRTKTGFLKKTLAACGNRGGENPEWWGDSAPTYVVIPWKTYLPVRMDGLVRWTNPPGMALIDAGKTAEAMAARMITARPDTQMVRLHRTNILRFRQVYECDPPHSEAGFFTQPELLDAAVDLARAHLLKPIAQVTPTLSRILDPRTGAVRERVALRLENIRMRPNVVYFVGGDAGEMQDSFALVVAHLIPPRESGSICPACFRDRARRSLKHYRPEPIPTAAEDPLWDPREHACDHCRAQPRQLQPGTDPRAVPPFWGVARPSGTAYERPILRGYDARGGEVWELEEVRVQDATGAWRYEMRPRVETVFMPQIVYDLFLEWRPDRTQGRTVDFTNVKDLILELHRFGQIGAARFDRWNATMMVQELQNAGIDAETQNFSNPDQLAMYSDLKMVVNEAMAFVCPDPSNPAIARAILQTKEVQLINGNKIDHPGESLDGSTGAKDLSDAWSVVTKLCLEHEVALGVIDVGHTGPERALLQQGQVQSEAALMSRSGVVGSALRDLGIFR